MTKKKQQKRLVRARMAKTGESYQSAQRLIAAQAPAAPEAPEPDVAPAPLDTWGLRLGDKEIAIGDAPLVVGRDPSSSGLTIEHPLASRKHATFRVTEGALTLVDHDSRNGTFRNGVRLREPVTLAVGDEVKIVESVMTVIRTTAPAGPRTIVAAPVARPQIPPNPAPVIVQASLSSPPPLGSVLAGRYKLERVVTKRTDAPWILYQATHTLLGAPLTLKLLPWEAARERPPLRAWLLREARALQRATHPQVQRVTDIVETHTNDAFLVLDALPERTLAERLAASGPDAGFARDIAMQLAEVLAHVHAKGIVHRDLRDDCVYLEDDRTVKLTSFSLATLGGDPLLPFAGASPGQTEWLAPELRRGEEGDARSDLYAVGVILYRLLTGAMPSEARTLPPGLDAICRQLLAADPAERPASAAAALDALRRAGDAA